MPHFFFDVHDGRDIQDDTGCDLPTIAAAQRFATRYAGNLLSELDGSFWTEGDWRMDIRNERGLILFSLLLVPVTSPAMSPVDRPT